MNTNRVAVARAAATLFVLLLAVACAARSEAAVRVEGLAEWLALAAERSLGAVYEHIPEQEPPDVKERLLRVVASRLLAGYSVRSIAFADDDDVLVALEPVVSPPEWDVSVVFPNLLPPADAWFAHDVADLPAELGPLMEGVPLAALSWGDLELKRSVEELCAGRLPGWRVSLMVQNLASDSARLTVSFTPEQPLTLAVSTRVTSTSIPVMLHSSLREDLLKGFAPVIGIPVPWLERHREDLVLLGKQILSEGSLVEQAKAEPSITVTTGTVSEIDIDLESRRYASWVWMAVYAGAEDRYPEVGLHFGRRMQLFPKWDMELYTELIMAMDDWNLESRLGMRWSPWDNVWLGGEWSNVDSVWWARASLDAKSRKPYAWVRYSQEGDTNGALGLRINEYLSIELHYDSRDSDPWNARALINL